jgi:hypothetical protein
MDLGNIVYVVAVIGYLIYQATRKKARQELEQEPTEREDPQQKPLTFEELMKEIRDAQRPAPAPEPEFEPEPEISVMPPRRIKKRAQAYVEPAEREETRYYEDTFESRNKNPFQAAIGRHTLMESPDIKMNYDSVKSKSVNPYAAVLKNPKTLRQAVIVSEILTPKHF